MLPCNNMKCPFCITPNICDCQECSYSKCNEDSICKECENHNECQARINSNSNWDAWEDEE